MPIDISVLSRLIEPEKTILIFGAGTSIPSGAPSGRSLRDQLGQRFKIDGYESFELADVATLAEAKYSRRDLVEFIRSKIAKLQPTGGLLNLPLFPWAGIFTTNYDTLIETAYSKAKRPLQTYSCNHDFTAEAARETQNLFKFHGTIEKDVCDGHNSRLIITGSDYDELSSYRELLYSRLRDQLFTKSAIIVGQSLADPDLRTLVDEAQKVKAKSGAPGKIYLFIFERSDALATIFEKRGLTVCFGGIDDLLHKIVCAAPAEQLAFTLDDRTLSCAPTLAASTISVDLELQNQSSNLHRMFNGRAATYADIKDGLTFDREVAQTLKSQMFGMPDRPFAILLGTAGVGKTTAARMALVQLSARGMECWEHKTDYIFDADAWVKVASELTKRKRTGVLLIDEAHTAIRDINRLVDALSQGEASLRLILVSSRPHWNPRLKSAELFKRGIISELSRLSLVEMNNLLDLLEGKGEVRALVEHAFLGFNRAQRLDRLRERCDADMFVCMKNIFGFQAIDTIILEEFASLHVDLQHLYRLVAGMQAIGVRVHRELIRRLTGLQASDVARALDDLEGIIEEYTVNARDGIYAWRVRHLLIANIIAKYKFSDVSELTDLFDQVIGAINPAYSFEVQSLSDMCDLEHGITRISDKRTQNVLLRKMISSAPSLRVPRHRLIHNLIDLCQFDTAESEIRVFEKTFQIDGPVLRYKVRLKLGIARYADGIMDEDRAALVSEALTLARSCVDRFRDDKNMYRVLLKSSVDYYRYTAKLDPYFDAMALAEAAQAKLLDPELRVIISRFTRTAEEMGVPVFD